MNPHPPYKHDGAQIWNYSTREVLQRKVFGWLEISRCYEKVAWFYIRHFHTCNMYENTELIYSICLCVSSYKITHFKICKLLGFSYDLKENDTDVIFVHLLLASGPKLLHIRVLFNIRDFHRILKDILNFQLYWSSAKPTLHKDIYCHIVIWTILV
jgi:hypothetical protein